MVDSNDYRTDRFEYAGCRWTVLKRARIGNGRAFMYDLIYGIHPDPLAPNDPDYILYIKHIPSNSLKEVRISKSLLTISDLFCQSLMCYA